MAPLPKNPCIRWAVPALLAGNACFVPACGDEGSNSSPSTAGTNMSSAVSGLDSAGSGSGSGGSAVASAGSAASPNTAGTAMGFAGSSGSSNATLPAEPHIPWDWTGILGTGQSLAVGEPGPDRGTLEGLVQSTEQPFQNLKLSTGSLPWPVDPQDDSLTLVPLTEPIGRAATGYPSSWPTNISGETPHSSMANQLSALVQAAFERDFVSVHGEVGENGQCLNFLIKGATPEGVNGRSFEAALIETRAITRLAQAEGKSYGVGAITVTHGECDAGNANYAQQLHQLWSDYATDLAEITGQAEPPLMIVSQQNSINDSAASTTAQWRIGVEYPEDVVCSGPKYQYPYTSDSIHLKVDGYRQLGEKYGQVFYERVVLQRDWRPLEPTQVTRDGRAVVVEFRVPVPPLAWEESFQAPHQESLTEWSAARGFELRTGGSPLGIESVAIEGSSVRIVSDSDLPATGVTVAYAMTGDPTAMASPFTGTFRWGQLRDSDPFVGSSTGVAQPNFSVAFELPVP